jgi:exopolysaccharide biosynthesis protein
MKRILGAFLMIVVATAMTASPCWACSCIPNDTKKDKAKRADVVFTGTVTSITDTDPSDQSAPLKVQFEVAKVYKGYPKEVTHVYTPKDGAMCGATFEVGKKYTVFAQINGGQKETSNCSGTKQGTIDPDFWGLPKAYEPQEAAN